VRTKACVFGLEGVVAETSNLNAQAWKQLFDPLLRKRAQESSQPYVPFDVMRDYATHFVGKAPLDDIRSFLDSRGVAVPDDTVRALAARKDELWGELLQRERLEPYEGSVRFAKAAREAGLRTAVVSTGGHCQHALSSAGIETLFDVVIDAEPLGTKHDGVPDAWLTAAQAIGVDVEQAAVIDDEIAGVEAARADHFGYVVGIDRSGKGAELRRHGADIVVRDLSALFPARDVTAP
jgi:HAD superfamily hydrolase (TIGR01509 family)